MKSFDDLKKYAISDILSASGKDKITRVAENHINTLIEVALIKGAQSRQSEVDELQKRIDALEKAEFKLAKVKSILEDHMKTNLLESIVVKRLINFVIKGEQNA